MRNFTRAGLFAGAIALGTLGSASLQSSTESIEAKPYLLKVSNVMEAAQLVESLGGSVTETAASISYLGAALTEEQLQLLSRSDLIVRIDEQQGDWSETANRTAGLWWRKKGNATAGLWWRKKGNAVAGLWWRKKVNAA